MKNFQGIYILGNREISYKLMEKDILQGDLDDDTDMKSPQR